MKHFTFLLLSVMFAFQTQAATDTPSLTTTGYGQVTAVPDMAEFSISIQEERSEAKQAKISVDRIVDKVLSSLTAMGIDRKDMMAGNLSLTPQYTYPSNSKPKLTGYQALRNIVVTVKDTEKLNLYLDKVLQLGVDRVNYITLKVQDEIKYKKQARDLAILDAQEKAQEVSKGFGTQLDGVLSIHYQANTSLPIVYKSMASESRMTNAGYMDESLLIKDQVEVVFKLKPSK